MERAEIEGWINSPESQELMKITRAHERSLVENFVPSFGSELRRIRNQKQMSVRELAQKTGIPISSLSEMENGKKRANKEIMRKLVAAFDEETLCDLELCRARDALAAEEIHLTTSARLNVYYGSPFEDEPGVPLVQLASTAGERYLHVYTDISHGFYVDGAQCETAVFPAGIANGADHTVLISDDSLVSVGVLPGTYLFIKRQNNAINGQLVIATIDGEEYVCRRYRRNSRRQWLEDPSGKVTDRIPFEGLVDVDIMGVVVAWWGKP